MSYDQSIEELANTIGNFIEYWGFKKAHGRAWTIIYLRKSPISSRELKELLGISKASLSNIINDLKYYDLIYDAGTTNYGAEVFTANPNIAEVIINVLISREKNLILDVKKALAQVSKLPTSKINELEISKERIKSLSHFVRHGHRVINGIIKLETVVFNGWRIFKK